MATRKRIKGEVVLSTARGLRSKICEMEHLAFGKKTAFLASMRSGITGHVFDSELVLLSYTVFRSGRNETRGVAIFISRTSYTCFWNGIRIRTVSARYYDVTETYHSGSITLGIHITDILVSVRKWVVDIHYLVLGDFSYPYVDWVNQQHLPGIDPFSRGLFSTLQDLSLFQRVSDRHVHWAIETLS